MFSSCNSFSFLSSKQLLKRQYRVASMKSDSDCVCEHWNECLISHVALHPHCYLLSLHYSQWNRASTQKATLCRKRRGFSISHVNAAVRGRQPPERDVLVAIRILVYTKFEYKVLLNLDSLVYLDNLGLASLASCKTSVFRCLVYQA